jgi:hypothetical protein
VKGMVKKKSLLYKYKYIAFENSPGYRFPKCTKKKKLHSHVTGSHQPFRKIHEGFPFCGKKKGEKSSGYTVRQNVHDCCAYMYVYTV